MMRRLCVSFGLWMPSQKHLCYKICLGIILISLLTCSEVDSKVNYLEEEVYRKLMQGGKMEIGLKSVWLKLIFLSFFDPTAIILLFKQFLYDKFPVRSQNIPNCCFLCTGKELHIDLFHRCQLIFSPPGNMYK